MIEIKETIIEDFEFKDEEIKETEIDKIIKYFSSRLRRPTEKENIHTETLNILLLGQIGCGKSTFINSFLNYMNHSHVHRLCCISDNYFGTLTATLNI